MVSSFLSGADYLEIVQELEKSREKIYPWIVDQVVTEPGDGTGLVKIREVSVSDEVRELVRRENELRNTLFDLQQEASREVFARSYGEERRKQFKDWWDEEIGPTILFKVMGSQAMTQLLVPRLAEEYLKEAGFESIGKVGYFLQPGVELVQGKLPGSQRFSAVFIQSGNSQVALDALETGKADFAAVYNCEELLSAAEVVAIDAAGVIVHPENSVESISPQNIRELLGGKVRSWQDLSGEATSPKLVSAGEGDECLGFLAGSLGMERVEFVSQIEPDRTFDSLAEVDRAIFSAGPGDRGCYAIVPLSVTRWTDNKVLRISLGDEIEYWPTSLTVKKRDQTTGDPLYPYHCKLGIRRSSSAVTGHKKGFSEFLRSPAANEVVFALGFAPPE